MSTTRSYPKSKSRSNIVKAVTYGGVESTQSESNSTVKWTDTITHGDNLDDWKGKLLRGEDATTGLTVDGRVLSIKKGTLVGTRRSPTGALNNSKTWTQRGDFGLSTSFSATNPSDISTTSADNRALGSFVSRVAQVNTTFQGGVFLGELAQAIHGIRHPAEGLRKLVDSYRHRATKLRSVEGFRVMRIPFEKHLAELWLEHAFHWTPLFHDVQDAVSAAAELTLKDASRPKSRPVRAQATVVTNSQTTDGGIQSFGGLRWKIYETLSDRCTVVYRGAVRVESLTSLAGKTKLLGFNPGSFLPTAWELVPYSFLIDYFTNVGDIMTGLSFPTANLRWSNRTIVREASVERWAVSNPAVYSGDLTYRLSSFSAPRVETNRRLISRSSYNGSFIPSLQLEVPGSGSKKWLNIAALAIAQGQDRAFRWL